jgi:hypothetical protein
VVLGTVAGQTVAGLSGGARGGGERNGELPDGLWTEAASVYKYSATGVPVRGGFAAAARAHFICNGRGGLG